jgi:hypothetical protein
MSKIIVPPELCAEKLSESRKINGVVFDGTEDIIISAESSIFNTPSGKCQITKMYVNPDTGKLEIEYDDTPIP